MKLPLKHIVILVICSLIGIFVYQAYWLTGLYRTMKSEMESNIRDAMRTSDFNEVVLRINDLQKDNVEHGSVTVSAGYDADGHSLVTQQTISYTDSTRQDTIGTVASNSSAKWDYIISCSLPDSKWTWRTSRKTG